MTSAPTKRRDASGKFAKKNPDCEPASKGYVKCVARKLGDHTHDNWVVSISYGILGVIGVLGLLFFGTGGYLLDQISIPTVLTGFVLFALYHLVVGLFTTYHHTSESDDMKCIKDIQKYEPPCEPKRGCEERE